MRVAFLLEQALAPVPGGTGRYSVELAAALLSSAAPDDDVTAWTAWHRRHEIEGWTGRVRRLPLPRRALVAAWERRIGPSPQGDLVHAPTLLMPRSKSPLVVTIHDAVPWTHPETLTARGARWHRAMGEFAAREAAAVTVPTRAVADELQTVLPELEPTRVHVLGAGVASAILAGAETAANEVRRRHGLPEEFVLSLATLEPRKGLDLLIEAIARLGASAPTLVLVGQPGWGGVEPMSLARQHGLAADAVRVLGRVPDRELGAILHAASVVVMPSRAEGFGLPVAEAMAVGTPVVSTDVPALVETAGGAAEIVPIDDAAALSAAIGRVLGDTALAARLRAAGLARATEHSWARVAERAWQLYRGLV